MIETLIYNSPCGELELGATNEGLCLCDWKNSKNHDRIRQRLERRFGLRRTAEIAACELLQTATQQLDEYFGGKRRSFDIPLTVAGTDFQELVWHGLLDIRFGETWSYARLSAHIGHPGAFRAVAGACGANALSVFVPCHRVVGSGDSPGGYAGGPAVKSALLQIESRKGLFREFSEL